MLKFSPQKMELILEDFLGYSKWKEDILGKTIQYHLYIFYIQRGYLPIKAETKLLSLA